MGLGIDLPLPCSEMCRERAGWWGYGLRGDSVQGGGESLEIGQFWGLAVVPRGGPGFPFGFLKWAAGTACSNCQLFLLSRVCLILIKKFYKQIIVNIREQI